VNMLRKSALLSAVAALAAAAVLVTGCGRKAPAPTGKKSSLTIAVVPKTTTNTFWLTVKAGADAAAKDTGVSIIWRGPTQETDIPGQMTILEDFINQRVDAIVMAACDSKALIPTVEKAIKSGTPVVTIDSGIDSNIAASFVATDNIKGAKAAADELAKLVGGKGKVGVIPFVSGAATSTMRENGFKEGIRKYKDIRVVLTLYCQSDISQGMAVTEDMLTRYPDMAGIFAANEPGAVGCARAIDQRGAAGKVKVVAFDAADDEIQALKRGTIQALVVQNPFRMGYDGIKTAVAIKNGRKVPRRIDTGVTVVTKDNMDQPEIQKILYPLKK